jgi:signal transduction histidine kinase
MAESSDNDQSRRAISPWFSALFLVHLFGSPTKGDVTPPEPTNESRVLTNICEIWEIPQDTRHRLYRVQTEIKLYYMDPAWNCAWGECQGRRTYLPIGDCPVHLKAGQRVAFDGVISPQRERFVWDRTKVQILEEATELNAEPMKSLSVQPFAFDKHLVTVEGLIDQQLDDATHITISLRQSDMAATVHVLKGGEGAPAFHAGDFVRVKGVYAPQFDRDGKLAQVNLWADSPAALQVVGSLGTDSRFSHPIIPVEMLQNVGTNELVHVMGTVRAHEPGKWVTLWDETGQVLVQSSQMSPLRFGDTIEAFGYPYVLGVEQCLHGALYRVCSNNVAPAPTQGATLRLAEMVRDLEPQEAAKRLPVRLKAIVTWAHEQTQFAYVVDGSGGVRLNNPKWETGNSSTPGTIVVVTGETAPGDFVPVVTNAVITRAGYWNLDEARPLVSLEEALTGVQDGRWVEMRGYVRRVSTSHGLVNLILSTSRGEFQGCTPASQNFDYLQGSIISIRGVCTAVSNSRHQLTGIQMWAPEAKYIQIEEPAPEDLFAVTLRPLNTLRQFNLHNALNQRVRTCGTVVLQAAGRYLYVQDGSDSVLALCEQTELLEPGTRVEVVGFPGHQGSQFLLREAAFRRVSAGNEPAPAQLTKRHSVDLNLEGLLARGEGTLLNCLEKNGETRLLIQNQDYAFEGYLDSPKGSQSPELKLGSKLVVTGVYEIQSDEYGRPHSFHLHLRSWNDLAVISQPPWWTSARLFRLLLSVITVSVLALVWSIVIIRKNRLLRHAQAELRRANDELELRVQARTRELEEQVLAKERARAELAETQQNLLRASHQAGMAVVATNVLHNVGNVLNSVNVSVDVMAQSLNSSRLNSLAKAADLLQKPTHALAQFLTEDPKGKVLPGYFRELANVLTGEQVDLREELGQLTRNIDHIKNIVAMQQGLAKPGGLVEEVAPQQLVEDSLQIAGTSFERHGIRLGRCYASVPYVAVDRHKVLQILINLLTNAQQAVRDNPAEKTINVSLSASKPARVCITVEDNGMGIAPEHLNRIFSQGFTTRKDGHGFGLHGGAIAARELGGSLSVRSDGLGRGAVFTLELPTERSAQTEATSPSCQVN